jgi:hypothetical protein
MAGILHWYCVHLLLATAEKGQTIKYRKTSLDGGDFAWCRLHLPLATAEKAKRSNH